MHPLSNVLLCFVVASLTCFVRANTDEAPDTFAFPLNTSAMWNKVQGTLRHQPSEGERAIDLDAKARSFLYTRSGVLPKGLAGFSHVQFTVRSAQKNDAAVELQFLERGGKAKFWRKVDLLGGGETTVEIPLRFFRMSSGVRPHWDEVLYFGVFFRDDFRGQIVDLALVAKDESGAWMHPSHVRDLAFGDKESTLVQREPLAVITDVKALDAAKLAAHMERVDAWLRNKLPGLGRPDSPPVLVVFEDNKGYQGFHERLGKAINARISAPTTDGYAVLGIASSTAAKNPNDFRPVFAHEFTHVFLDKVVGIPSERGDWFQEGFATLVQLHFHP